MNGEKKLYRKIVPYLVCIFGIIGLIIWGCTSPIVSSAADKFVPSYLHAGWSQKIGNESIPLEVIHDYKQVKEGESLVFTCTLPQIEDGQVFLFYTINKEVRCYIDEVLVQDFIISEKLSCLKTPGNAWNQIELDSSMSGKSCTLIFHSPLGIYDVLCDIYLIQDQYVDTVRVANFGMIAFSTIELFLIIIILLTTGFVRNQPRRRRYLWSIAQYFVVELLWLLAELNFYDIFLGRPIISYLMLEVFYRMIPLVLLYLVKNSTSQYWHPKIFKLLMLLAWINLLMPFGLQFTLGISLLEMKIVHVVIYTFIGTVLVIMIVEKLCYFKKLEYEEYPCIATLILIISGIFECATLYLNKTYNPFAGFPTVVGGVLFSFVSLILLTYINSRTAYAKVEIEKSYHDLENKVLVKQVEAHFIFNALNTISAFCKTNPSKADRAIKTFASYLREYIHFVNARDNIPIEKELVLVKNYLAMQQMRFGEELQFSFHTEFLDFSVPPFTVQTLIENAVLHGVWKKKQGGIITISTIREENMAKLMIADDGVGFDTSKPINKSSVGLTNVKKRLKIMKNGTIKIDSTIGVGTTVVVTIPIKEKASF